jgi:hypothetical protein
MSMTTPPTPVPHPGHNYLFPLPPIHLFPPQVQLVLDALPDFTVVVVLAIALAFTIFYRGFFNYRKTAPGRALAIVALGASEILALAVLVALFGNNFPFRWLLREVVFIQVGVGFLLLLRALFHAWRTAPGSSINVGEAKPRRRGAQT